jgi:chromosome segregation and condensation protein ScpB
MPLPYKQNKIHNEKWRESNKDKYNDYMKAYMKRIYILKKAKMELLAILLD